MKFISGRRVFITAVKLTGRPGVERYEAKMLAQVTAIPVRLPGRRKSKVSLAMLIIQGLGGPKAMAKAAADGQTVNIPSLPQFFNGVTKFCRWIILLDLCFLREDVFQANPGYAFEQIQASEKFCATAREIPLSGLPRKASRVKVEGTVPKTNTGGQVEKTKANE